jgi:ABC-type polysaccharide/polyol phosphate transport system ATPase subunit
MITNILSQDPQLIYPLQSIISSPHLQPEILHWIDSNTAITLEHISKVYRLYNHPMDRLKESMHPLRKKYHRDFFALRDISLEVKRGETFGIIGKNGSGKSTLLKIINGVLTPSQGRVVINGNLSALLELGAGFNPELTGMENVYFNGTTMGYSKEMIEAKLDDILSFADIGDFIHQPMKMYSNGMYVRLAFAVAISIEPEILILDEALAVGDLRFQQKCFRKINEFRDRQKTILFVSHDIGAVINFCDKAIWLKEGEVFQIGKPEEVCKNYIAYMSYDSLSTNGLHPIQKKEEGSPHPTKSKEFEWEDVKSCSSFGEGGAEIKKVTFYAVRQLQKLKIFEGGIRVKFLLTIEIKIDILLPIIGLVLKDIYGNSIFGLNNFIYGVEFNKLRNGSAIVVEFEFDFPKLKNGKYSFSVAIAEGTQMNHIQHHWVHDAYLIEIVSHDIRNRQEYYLVLDNVKIQLKDS